MESRLGENGIKIEGKERYSLTADAIRGQAAIPYNSPRELIPYPALRSWIKKEATFAKSCFFFWWSLLNESRTTHSIYLMRPNPKLNRTRLVPPLLIQNRESLTRPKLNCSINWNLLINRDFQMRLLLVQVHLSLTAIRLLRRNNNIDLLCS